MDAKRSGAALPPDPFGRDVRLPAAWNREHRVRLLGEVFLALVEGRQPSREAALFVGGGGLSWLSEGGDLLREYWQVSAPRSSHHTPSHVWRAVGSSRGATDVDDAGTIAP